MRPTFFDNIFFDDRKFVLELCQVTVNGKPRWAVITRKNVLDYPPFKSNDFETKEEALDFYKAIVVETPLKSLNGQSPNPKKTIDEYKFWLTENGLTDDNL